MLKKALTVLITLSIILAIGYMIGPKTPYKTLNGTYPEVPTGLAELEAYIHHKEDTVQGLKTDNQARIIWADSLNKAKTPYSIIYIHGFGASPMEGDPVHRKLAQHFGANLYLARLPEHGIKRANTFAYLTADQLAYGAREAFMIGKSLGDSVIIMGTSMGGALSLLLASERSDIKSLLLYSPCIRDHGRQLEGFFRPWVGWAFEKFSTNEHQVVPTPREGEKAKYWSEEYHINGYKSLAQLIYSRMNKDTFQKVDQPLFLGYYFKDEENQDPVVEVPAMTAMYEAVRTPEAFKQEKAFPEAGDHVICSDITSQDWEGVLEASIAFLEDVVKLPTAQEEEMVLSDSP